MKTNRLFIDLCLIVLGGASPMMGQSKKEKQQKKEKAVSLAIEARKYKIDVNRATPMKGGSKYLTSPYSIEVRNDSLYSYLPYFGVAYNIPYGGGKGLNFKESISEYTTEHEKKGKTRITLKLRNDEDSYVYNITIYPNGTSDIQVTPTNKQAISFSGEMGINLKE